jgi:hypothetical protein
MLHSFQKLWNRERGTYLASAGSREEIEGMVPATALRGFR